MERPSKPFLSKPVLALLATLLPLGVACGSEPGMSGEPSPPEPVPEEEAVETLVTALCDAENRCANTLGYYWPEGLDCRASMTSPQRGASLVFLLEALIRDDRIEYDADAMARCVEALESDDCSEFRWHLLRPNGCEPFLTGTVAAGGACSLDVECAEGLCGGDTCPSTCIDLPTRGEVCEGRCFDGACNDGVCTAYAELGDSCRSSSQCEEGVCEGGTCRRAGSVGTSCQDPDHCRSGYCDHPDGAYFGTCREPLGSRVPCAYTSDCPSWAPICAGEAGGKACLTIRERSTAAEGEACSTSGGSAPLCRSGLSCVGRFTGACRRPVAPGEACTEATPSLCPAGYYCAIPSEADEGTCTPLPVEGEPCAYVRWYSRTTPFCGEGYRCDEYGPGPGICRSLRPEGAACESDFACETGYCLDGVCRLDYCEI